MKLRDFCAFVEDNSRSGDCLVFYDKTKPNTHYADAGLRYKWSCAKSKKSAIIRFKPDDCGEYLERDEFVEKLQSFMRYGFDPDMKCEVVLYDQNGENPQHYLTDPMWSHVTSNKQSCFAFDNPVSPDDVNKRVLGLMRDYVVNAASLDGGC
ncbi:MAG: hypothetical protein IJ087_21550 [Eggerthellaceae bacterium]|nr:hypothetical protein [Eggerthellaceae bacterium]